jgi:hypothetical protein
LLIYERVIPENLLDELEISGFGTEDFRKNLNKNDEILPIFDPISSVLHRDELTSKINPRYSPLLNKNKDIDWRFGKEKSTREEEEDDDVDMLVSDEESM